MRTPIQITPPPKAALLQGQSQSQKRKTTFYRWNTYSVEISEYSFSTELEMDRIDEFYNIVNNFYRYIISYIYKIIERILTNNELNRL